MILIWASWKTPAIWGITLIAVLAIAYIWENWDDFEDEDDFYY